MTNEERLRLIDIVETSRDHGAMESAAVDLAASEDPAAVARLGELLSKADTLARLDDLGNPIGKMSRLARVRACLPGRRRSQDLPATGAGSGAADE
jgi:hypothetical protein